MDQLSLEVIAAVIVLVAVAGERLAELFGSGLFTVLKQYGISVNSKDIRTVIMVTLVTVFNFAILYGLDIDVLAKLLTDNSSYVTIGLAAFTASGLSGISHGLIKRLGGQVSIIDALQTTIDLLKEVEEEVVTVDEQ